jgi:hypothetical protein
MMYDVEGSKGDVMPRGITEKDVWTACDALLLAGERPTIERVRQKIGRGSPNTVSPMLDTWFRGLGARISDPGAFAAAPDIPEPVQQAARHFWDVALAATRQDFDERLREGMAAAVANVEAEKERAATADSAAYTASARMTRLEGELAERSAELDRARVLHAGDLARLEEARHRIEALAQDVDAALKHARGAEVAQAEAAGQLNSMRERIRQLEHLAAEEREARRHAEADMDVAVERAKSAELEVKALQRVLLQVKPAVKGPARRNVA